MSKNNKKGTGEKKRGMERNKNPLEKLPGIISKFPKGGNFFTSLTGGILVFLIVATLYSMIAGEGKKITEIAVSQIAQDINAGTVKNISVEGDTVQIEYLDGSHKKSKKEVEASFSQTLVNYGVKTENLSKVIIEVKNESSLWYWVVSLLPFLLPILLIGFFFWFLSRQVKGAGAQAFMFGQSKARIIDPSDAGQKVTFKDVAGAKEAKEELVEIVDFLRSPQKFLDIGARIPKGVLLMGAPGTGKCVTGETRLLTQKGLMRIDDVPKYFAVNKDNTVEGLGIVTLDPKDLGFHEAMASHWYHLGEQATVQVTTDAGIPLEGTKEHPVVIVDEKSGNLLFRRLEEIKEGDFVAVACNTNRFGSYTKIPSSDAAYLMGVLTGDGCLTVRNRITLSTADKEILDRVQDIAHTVLNGAVFSKTSSRPYDYEMRNATAKGLLLEWGLSETYAEGKRIPEWIRMAPKEYVVAFLRGLFDTDGCAEKRGNVNISSASESLIADIQMMLLNIGIVARSYNRKKKYNGKNQFYLSIYGDFVEQFQREIGFTIKRKKKVLEETCARQRNTNVNYIPHQGVPIQTVWSQAVATTALTLDRSFYNEPLYKNTKRYINADRSPSMVGMNRFLDGVMNIAPQVRVSPEIAHLKRLSSGQFFFTQVKRIEYAMKHVYDLTVPHTHNFVANGIINHNTLLARAVAGEAGVPFFHLSGSEFVEMFVGVGASRVRDLFKMAKKAAPAIIFIDEIDAVGRVRGGGVGGGNDEREQTLNQILVEMDGFEPTEKVIVIAATNMPDVLDPALLRPGRFDRRVTLELPDREGREEILEIHKGKKPLSEDVNLKIIAERTPGFSGADLYSLMNEGAILAAREGRTTVAQFDFIRAIEKVMLGPERKSHILSKEEKRITAYHEAGHALVSSVLQYSDPVHKISIIARGHAGGYTLKLPLEETRLHSKKEFLDDIAMSLGGFVAEEMVFGDTTTGPSNDLQVATATARDMVTKYGMSEKLGPVALEGFRGRALFGGRGVDSKDYSEDVSKKIDEEVSKIMNDAFVRARAVCTEHRKALDSIAEELISKESIERDEFEKLLVLNGIKPKRKANKEA